MKCPYCHSRTIIRTSREITDITREAYYQCTNVKCGCTFRCVNSIVNIISPSAIDKPLLGLRFEPDVTPPKPPS